MNRLKFLILITVFLGNYSVFSFPVSLNDNWIVREGKHLSIDSDERDKWQIFEKMPVTLKAMKDAPTGKVVSITAHKKIRIPEKNLKNLREDVGILFPYIANAYSVYFNGKKISENGSFTNEEILKKGNQRNLVVPVPRELLSEENDIFVVLS
ncbi:MAG: hypothetical protein K8R21_09565, partial [Leptospira sp.]|nr:hypothetical protein [Leptospira sp.]